LGNRRTYFDANAEPSLERDGGTGKLLKAKEKLADGPVSRILCPRRPKNGLPQRRSFL
jgi:hypothetical protein